MNVHISTTDTRCQLKGFPSPVESDAVTRCHPVVFAFDLNVELIKIPIARMHCVKYVGDRLKSYFYPLMLCEPNRWEPLGNI